MSTKCANCPLRQKSLFVDMSAADLEFMEKFKVGEMVIDAGTPILMEGSNSPQLYTALHGMGLRHKILSGGQRQVLNFVFPGDFIGLQAGILGEMGHSVEATTRMTLCVFDRSELWTFFRNHPERAYDLTWLAAMEEHFLGEALSTVGQRTALSAVAWAFLRIYQRASSLGIGSDGMVRFPFKQQDLADALGLSLVHTNKTLRRLRERQLATWREDVITIPDVKTLASFAGVELAAEKKRPLM